MDAISSKLSEMDRLNREIQEANTQIAKYERELVVTGSSKTMVCVFAYNKDDIQHEHAAIQTKCKETRKEIERINGESRRIQSEIQAKNQSVREAQEHIHQFQRSSQEGEQLSSSLNHLRSELDRLMVYLDFLLK